MTSGYHVPSSNYSLGYSYGIFVLISYPILKTLDPFCRGIILIQSVEFFFPQGSVIYKL